MAIASGLPCVDYLASNFYSPTYIEDDFRYSPTFAYDNDVLTSYISRKQQQKQHRPPGNVFEAPFLEFTRLSLAETTFDFTTSSRDEDHLKTQLQQQQQQQNQNNSRYNEEFITEFEKMRSVLNSKRTPTKTKEEQKDDGNTVRPFSVNNEPCQCLSKDGGDEDQDSLKSLYSSRVGATSSDSEDEDEELDAIFTNRDSPSKVSKNTTGRCFNRDAVRRFQSTSLPHYNHMVDKEEEEEVSDSEMELARIITPRTPPQKLWKPCPRDSSGSFAVIIGGGSNRKRRTSADSPGEATEQQSPNGGELQLGSLTKRPFIDAEKMHRSMVLRSSRPCLRKVRRNLDKDLFVPIIQ